MTKALCCILIDDDTDEHELFGMAIADTTHEVSCRYFHWCEQAIHFLTQRGVTAPDFIFVDLLLAHASGQDCLTNLLKLPALQAAKIYVYSGMQQDESEKYIKSLQVAGFLQKQPSVKLLSEALKALFEKANP